MTKYNYGHTSWVFNTIADTLNSNWGNKELILANISKAIGLETLREDINLFLRKTFNINELPDKDNLIRVNFIETVAYLILDRPIYNIKDKSKQYRCGKLDIIHEQTGKKIHISKVMLTSHKVEWERDNIACLSIFVDPKPPKHINDDIPLLIFQI
ncbi:hypothetical protein, partial [Facilibium subflavum]|uniref:hypothetical protein n=1 Tax=Facilibium subflavum TaxID=2219058 RepID=UPI0013C2BC5C